MTILPERRMSLVWFSVFLLLLLPTRIPAEEERDVVINAVGMEFVYIEPGTFMMGSPEDERFRSESEVLHHRTIEEAFYMQTTPVTIGQWQAVMGRRWFLGRRGDSDTPVTRVSWHEAMGFINELNKRKDDTYRLPTEAEWEYAARAGTTTPYPWGDEIDCSRAMYANNRMRVDDCVSYVRSIGLVPNEPAPVKTYPPNPWGLYDMHGNVWEWIADCFGAYTEPEDQEWFECTRRVRRGGSWFSHGYQARSANRAYAHPAAKFRTTGFRVVKEAH